MQKLSLEEMCKNNIRNRKKQFIKELFGIYIPAIVGMLLGVFCFLGAAISLMLAA